MKKITLWFRAVFGFSQTEINGFLFLLIIMVLLLIAPFFYPYLFKKKPYDSTGDDKILQKLLAIKSLEKEKRETERKAKKEKNRLYKKTYTRKKERDYNSTKYINSKNPYDTSKYWKKTFYKKREITSIEINSADTNAFRQIKGIGKVLSKRIIKRRTTLGGFHSLDQLKKIYGLDSLLLEQNKHHFLEPDLELIKKININTTTVKELGSHPYISYKKARVIINYRLQHGDFTSLEDLKAIHVISQEELNIWKYYLSI